jgi:hypothetical protein
VIVMPPESLDRIVLGHNSFFGVNHLSKQHGADREAMFEDTQNIIRMMETASAANVTAMMMSTHPRASAVANVVRGSRELRDNWSFYPLLPYITKYVKQANEKGMVNIVLDQLKAAGWTQMLGILARGGLGALTKDYRHILATMIGLELAPFEGLKLHTVYLHDVLTDLALALDIPEVLELHATEIRKRFGARPGYATKNLPLLLERFQKYGFEKPLVLVQINKIGFGMNPSREACERALVDPGLEVMAMGTLASGYLKPKEAYEYIFTKPAVKSVVVGVSTPAHAAETFAAVRDAAPPLR